MGLSANLRGVADLDPEAIARLLLDNLAGPIARMAGVDLPLDADAIAGLVQGAGAIDTDNLGGSITALTGQITPVLSLIPGADQILAPLEGALVLVEQISTGDLPNRFTALAARLGAELDGARAGGLIAALTRFAEILGNAPEGQVVRSILDGVLRLTGAELPPDLLVFPNAVPAVAHSLRAVTGLMTLESVLGESERLTGLMSRQLDPEQLTSALAGVEAAFGAGESDLAAFIGRMDPADDIDAGVARRALEGIHARLAQLRDVMATGLGFGEATLAYLDVDAVQREIDAAATGLRGLDLGPVERALQSLSRALDPILRPDLSGLPTFSFDDLLTRVEGQVDSIADTIRGVDLGPVARPIEQGVGAVTSIVDKVADVIEGIVGTIRSALDQVRQAIEALPIDTVLDAIRTALSQISGVLDTVRDAIATVQAALETAVGTVTDALEEVEGFVDGFKATLQAAFAAARAVVEQFDIDAVVGAVADKVQAFADLLAKAQMKPYFDTAVDVIGTTADVVSAIPFDLLPDSMKQDVDAAVAPVKAVDVRAVEREIEGALQIEDGRFKLNDVVREGLVELQAKYDELIDTVRGFDPHAAVDLLDVEMENLSTQIGELTPQLALEPVQAAIDQVKQIIADVDLRGLLRPIDEAFDEILTQLDRFNPAQLVRPIEDRVDEARQALVDAIKLDEWRPKVDEVAERAVALIDVIDPDKLRPVLQEALTEGRALLDRLPDISLSAGMGAVFASLSSGSGERVYPGAFTAVVGWLTGAGGTDALQGRATRISDAIAATRAAVSGVVPNELSVRLAPRADALRAAVRGLADGPTKTALLPLAENLDVQGTLTFLGGNRDRYLQALMRSAELAETLRRTGLSEADALVQRLRASFSPLTALKDLVRELAHRVGLPGLEEGVAPALRRLFDIATPERIVGLIMPVFVALRDRLEALVDAFADPLRAAIDELERLVAAVDITPLREGIDAVFAAVRDPIAALRPTTILEEPLTSFEALQAAVAEFDPLGPITEGLNALRDTVQRVIGKLKASELLADPLAIYDHIIGELEALRFDQLLEPVFTQLDEIARQVDQGLDETVVAFERLQEALPGGPGSGGSASASVSIG